MTAPHADQLIDGYLARLRVAAAHLPASQRDELMQDVRTHISEARAREADETDASILNILDRLGQPEEVVAEAGARLNAPGSGSQPAAYRPGVLEIAALVLLPFLWPIGVILLWVSPAWRTRDKLIGTLVLPGGYPGLLFVGGFLALGAGGTCGSVTEASGHVVQSTCSGGSGSALVGALLPTLAIALLFLPLVSAAYLAIRLRWGRRLIPSAA